MKILFLSYDTVDKGVRDQVTYSFIEKEMKALSEAGHSIYYLSRNLRESIKPDKVHYLSMSDLLAESRARAYIRVLLLVLFNPMILARLALVNRHRALHALVCEAGVFLACKKYHIEIIHTHFLWPAGLSAVLSATQLGIPVVATLRGAELVSLPEFDYGSMRDPFFRVSTKFSFKKISAFSTPNRYYRTKLLDEHGVPESRIRYLPNGVERIDVDSYSHEKDPEYLQLISVGRLIKLKNHTQILHAMALLKERRIKLTIVGVGDELASLTREVELLGLTGLVSVESEMEKQALLQKFASSDCLVHASYSEGMPNVVLESLALGVPCLVSDIPVHRELIRNGENGWIFELDSPDRLAELLQRVLINRSRFRQMRENCVLSTKGYALEAKIAGYNSIYRTLTA